MASDFFIMDPFIKFPTMVSPFKYKMSAAVGPSHHGGDCGGDPPDGGNRHPLSGCATSGPKQGGRKKTKNLSLKKSMNKNAKKPLHIDFEKGPKGTYVAVGPNSDNFNMLSGTIVSRIPPYFPSWAKVPSDHTGLIFQELKTYFKMKTHLRGPGSKQLKVGLNKYFASLYRSQKHKFNQKYFVARGGLDRAEQLREDPPAVMTPEEWRKFVDFKTSPAFQRRSQANKGCRSKQSIIVRHGRKNQAHIRHDNPGKSCIELWKERRQKDKEFTETEAAELYADMTARQNDPNCTLTDEEIMEQVLGERRGWTRGVGPRLPKSAFYEPGSSSTASSQPQQPTFTADQVRTMVADYTAPIWDKLGIQPPPLNLPPPQIAGNDHVGEDDDSEDDEDSSSEDDS